MVNDGVTFWEYLLVTSLFLSLTSIALTITIAFPKIVEVERKIASPGKQLDGIRAIWGGGPIGRWMRATWIFGFFLFRNIPVYGERLAARMGDETEPLPLRLKLWATLPQLTYLISITAFFALGEALNLDH